MNQKRRHVAARQLLSFVVLALALAAPLAAAPEARPQAVQDQFLVKFKDGTAERGNAALRQRRLDAAGHAQGLHLGQRRRLGVGADVIHSDRPLDYQDAKALLLRLRADPRVEYAEVDAPLFPAFVPNDTQYASQWNYFEPAGGINAPAAWDISTGAGEVVAVLDSGITAHSDLAANLVAGYDFIADPLYSADGDGRDADPTNAGTKVIAGECGAGSSARSSSWHGTHVAGTIAAVTNNAMGVAGVAFGAKVQPVRVLGKCFAATSDVSDAILWAAGVTVSGVPANPTPANVINLSIVGDGLCSAATQAAIDAAVARGVTVVAAAGNSNVDAAIYQPGNCANVITVTANDRIGEVTYYSNGGRKVEISAPGGDTQTGSSILSTYNTGTAGPLAESYAGFTGTSKSAAHVSGVIALVRAAGGGSLTPAQISALLQGTARVVNMHCAIGCGAGIVDAGAAVAIAAQPLLFVSDAAVVDEGNSGTHALTFTVSLSRPVASDVTFDIGTQDGTAVAGSDYVAKSVSNTIHAGEQSRAFIVAVNGDTQFEGDESFSVVVSNVTGPVVVADPSGSATIPNGGDVLVLENGRSFDLFSSYEPESQSAFTFEVPEGANNLEFVVENLHPIGNVDLYVRYGAAPTLDQFDCASSTYSLDETCTLVAKAGTWYGMAYTREPYVSRPDGRLLVHGSYDDGATLSVGDASITEGNSGTKEMTFTVSLSRPSAVAVTYDIVTWNSTATAGSDYVASSLTRQTIPAGQLSKTFSLTINGDTTVEADEKLVANLQSVGGATVFDGQGLGTITNDDLPGLRISDASVTEGDAGGQTMTFTASLTQATNTPVNFNVAAQSGTASVGSDFDSLPPTTFSIPAGQTTTTVHVVVVGDTAVEADETLLLNLSAVTGATLQDGQGVGTIINDDLPTLSIGNASVTEGNAGTKLLTFTAGLSQAAGTAVSFTAATQNGTATAGSDFVALTPTAFSIPAGQTSKTVSVTINGDTAVEPDETLLLDLSAVTGATLQGGQGVGTIANDDASELRISDAAITEGNSGTKVMTFTASLSQAALTAVTYDIATADNTATAGSDFVASALAGQSIPAGQLSRTFNVTLNGDTTVEANESLRVNLTNGSVDISDNQGTGIIINDDGPTLSIADAGFVEGDAGTKTLLFTVSLSQASPSPVTYNIATGGGTATAGTDYISRSLTGESIPAGQMSKTFLVTVNGDTSVEGNETFFVTLSNGNVSVADSQAKATITNDDGPVLSIGDATITETNAGSTMIFAVSLSKVAGAAVTFDFATVAGTALAGPDYVPTSVTGLKIPAGQLSKVVSVPIKGDLVAEPDETFTASISLSNVSIKDGVGVGTIVNDD